MLPVLWPVFLHFLAGELNGSPPRATGNPSLIEGRSPFNRGSDRSKELREVVDHGLKRCWYTVQFRLPQERLPLRLLRGIASERRRKCGRTRHNRCIPVGERPLNRGG